LAQRLTVPATSDPRLRLLFLAPGPVPPPSAPTANQYHYLSRFFRGDLVTTTWLQTAERAAQGRLEAEAAMGGIGYHAMRIPGVSAYLRPFKVLWYLVRTGLRLSRREGRYDAIVTYGALTTGMAGLILKRLTGSPLIVDMPGHPFRGLELQGGAVGRLKAAIARRIVPIVLKRADAVKLLYPSQLDDLRMSRRPRTAVFHDFTAVGERDATGENERYILLLGYPWYLKGADVLIRAFLRIADRHPDHRLLIVGHCPDRAPFERLAAGHPRIELRSAVFPAEAGQLMQRCSMFVLPSRTEAMGRVVLEAYAARKPVIASRVDGLPYVIEDGRTGLLFESENDAELATRIDELLTNPQLALRLATAGYERVHRDLGEDAFAERYAELVSAIVARPRAESVRAPA
jgi:glycosyltransferase involved in cell wall biosynthesis